MYQEVTQGDDGVVIDLYLSDKNVAIDITNSTVKAVIKFKSYTTTKVCTIKDPITGYCQLILNATDTAFVGLHAFQIQIEYVDGRKFSSNTVYRYNVKKNIGMGSPFPPPPTAEESALIFETEADLMNAYPNGTDKPVWVKSAKSWYYWESDSTPTDPVDTTAPNNVTNLQATNITQTGLTLTWTASTSTDVVNYQIYKDGVNIGQSSGTEFIVSELTSETTYNFIVKVKDVSLNESSGTSVGVTTLSVADTAPPILTITPSSTFSDTQNVTMSTDETATIYYTLDGSTPTQASLVYSSVLTLSQTTTVKAFAKDMSGNESTIKTEIYTKDNGEALINPVLSFNGVSDYMQLPTLTFDEIQMDVMPMQSATPGYLFDARTGSDVWLSKNANGTDSFPTSSKVYMDGKLSGSGSTAYISENKRTTLKSVFLSPSTDDVTFFARSNFIDFLKANVYKIKLLLAGAEVAHYDLTTRFNTSVVPDISGNSNDATLHGGTWVEDPSPILETTIPHHVSLDGVNDSITLPIPLNVKYVELTISRENNDLEGYVLDMRNGNVVYSGSVGSSGYNTVTIDGASKTVNANNATADLINGVTSTIKYTLTNLTISAQMVIGTRSALPMTADYMALKVHGVSLYNNSNVVINEFDFTTGEGNTIYGSDGMNGSINGGTWIAT